MTTDPQIVAFAALAMAIGWTMTFSGLKKHVLELKRRERTSCGRHISGAVCRASTARGEHPLSGRSPRSPRAASPPGQHSSQSSPVAVGSTSVM